MVTTKLPGAKIYSISGIHRSTNAKKLESKILAKRIVNKVAVGGIPADASIEIEAESFGGSLTAIPHARILKKADSATGTEDDTVQQAESDSSANVNSDDSSPSQASKDQTSSDSAAATDDSSKPTTVDDDQKGTTTKGNGNALTTDDQVIAPVFFY